MALRLNRSKKLSSILGPSTSCISNNSTTLQALWLRALALLNFTRFRTPHFLPRDRLKRRTSNQSGKRMSLKNIRPRKTGEAPTRFTRCKYNSQVVPGGCHKVAARIPQGDLSGGRQGDH